MQQKIAKHPMGIVGVLMFGTFIAILNQTLMTTALPHLMVDFKITSNTAQWLTTGFMLVNGIMIPITAFLIQRFSIRSLFFYCYVALYFRNLTLRICSQFQPIADW
ncbi:MFS transporter [Enterococcus hermanniensis]|uniref:MFS transporter n=1 Tax=Enterococcus hermanniensis TaxID=249189 RepID=UPI000B2DE6FB|nr:MFS transporter [Enterococcus hermanniensis]